MDRCLWSLYQSTLFGDEDNVFYDFYKRTIGGRNFDVRRNSARNNTFVVMQVDHCTAELQIHYQALWYAIAWNCISIILLTDIKMSVSTFYAITTVLMDTLIKLWWKHKVKQNKIFIYVRYKILNKIVKLKPN